MFPSASNSIRNNGAASVAARAADRKAATPARPPAATARLRVTVQAELARRRQDAIASDTHAIAVDDDSSTRNPCVDPFDTQSMWDE